MNKSVTLWLTCVVLAVVVLGCPRRKTVPDAGSDAETAQAADAATSEEPTAANSNDVARFGDENKIENEAATLKENVVARISPPNGTSVTNLTKGTNVTKIASRENFVLIVFPNPKNNSENLMGWVPGLAVGEAATAGGGGTGTGGGTGGGGGGGGGTGGGGGHVTPKDAGGADAGGGGTAGGGGGGGLDAGSLIPQCPAGQVALLTPPGKCAKKCTSNADCAAGKPCAQAFTVLGPQKVCAQ